jgi:seryl-tRNA synthetase
MADKISVSYDANIDEFKRKLDELIQKNLLLKGAVDDATKSLTAMGQVVDGQAKKVTINIKNTQDYRTILNEVNKVVNDSRQILKAATDATETNTKAQNDNAQATQKAGAAKKAKTDAVVVNSKAVQDNSIKLTQNNTVHNNHSKTLDQSVKNVTNLNTKLVENNKHIQDNRTYVKNITDSYNRYVNGVGQASNSTNGLSGVLGQLQSRLIAAFSIQSLWQFGESVVDTTRKVELMQNRLSFVFGSVTGGREAFDRLYNTSQKLGIGFQRDVHQGGDCITRSRSELASNPKIILRLAANVVQGGGCCGRITQAVR